MFGHDNQDEHQDDQAHNGQVTAPTDPVVDDNLGLGDESPNDTGTTAPPVHTTTEGFIVDPVTPTVAPTATVLSSANGAAVTDDLLTIKQQALHQLSPLVGHLNQTPEEKFRTLMMMIQASDDQSKLKEAYEIAQQIPDEKVRAQALLDVVNEINYFTQQHKDKP